METGTVENTQETAPIHVESGYEGSHEVTEGADDSSYNSNESENVSHETNEYSEVAESKEETYLRELRELREEQRQLADLIARNNYQQPSSHEEEPLTARDIVRQEYQAIQREQFEFEQAQRQQSLEHEFQTKISSARSRFKDFEAITSKINCVTPAMLGMIKASEDPAAFSFHAAKSHAEELQRISALPTPEQQSAAMVRLEDKIRSSLKPRTVSRAPSPLSETSGSAGLSGGYDTSDIEAFARHLRERAKKR